MNAYLLTLGFLAAFVIGFAVAFKLCEYYNRIIRKLVLKQAIDLGEKKEGEKGCWKLRTSEPTDGKPQ